MTKQEKQRALEIAGHLRKCADWLEDLAKELREMPVRQCWWVALWVWDRARGLREDANDLLYWINLADEGGERQ